MSSHSVPQESLTFDLLLQLSLPIDIDLGEERNQYAPAYKRIVRSDYYAIDFSISDFGYTILPNQSSLFFDEQS